MPRIDENRDFQPIRIAVLTVSDTRTIDQDRSGDTLVGRLIEAGHILAERALVTDDVDAIRDRVSRWIADKTVQVVLTTGGTGITARDVTPQAIEPLYERKIDGFGELFRWLSHAKIGASTIQSRASAGVAGRTLLFLLPGSPGACRDAWDDILKTQLDNRFQPCNFVELLPRL